MTVEDLNARTLATQFPFEQVGTNTDDEINFGYDTGWSSTVVTTSFGTKIGFVYKINTWDLTGYTLQDRTLFPQTTIFQDMNEYPAGGSQIAALTRMTIVSTTPLNEENLTSLNSIAMWNTPGSMGSEFNLDHIVRGRLEMYQADANLANTLHKTEEKNWGTADSTAADKMWIAEVYFFYLTSEVSGFFIPNSAVVMPSLVGKESELEYLMRLSRSIEPVY